VNMAFHELGIVPWLCRLCDDLKMLKPTDIQTLAIPLVLAGKDVCGNARTGSGKTAAFALPIVQELAKDPYGVFALVLTPTRELALQISQSFTTFGASMRLSQAVLIGGMDAQKQAVLLERRPHVVTATPGRLIDFLQGPTGNAPFKKLRYLVLDEADRLLDQAFLPSIKIIVKHMPTNRRTLFFSATLTPELKDTTSKVLTDITKCEIVLADANKLDASLYSTAKNLKESYIWIPKMLKLCYLAYLLDPDNIKAKSVMVFCSTCRETEFVRLTLQLLGLPVVSISSHLTQSNRFMNLSTFKGGQARILIATDVASRGLDIPTVELVLNYDLPRQPEDYIHRVGRTARAGRGGCAITFVTPEDVKMVHQIEAMIGHALEEEKVDEDAAAETLDHVAQAQLKARLHYEQNFKEVKSNSERRVQVPGMPSGKKRKLSSGPSIAQPPKKKSKIKEKTSKKKK